MKPTLPYLILLLGVSLWCTMLVLPPLAASSGHEVVAHQLYRSFSPICHQFESRSLHLFGYKQAVCSRCSAIYFGFFVGVLLVPILSQRYNRQTIKLLLIASAPMLIDVLCDLSGFHASNIFTRLMTGSFFGIVSALILSPYIIEALTSLLVKQNNNQKASYEFKT